jgi:hypothetical protein
VPTFKVCLSLPPHLCLPPLSLSLFLLISVCPQFTCVPTLFQGC